MNAKLTEILERRQRLVAIADNQRAELALHFRQVERIAAIGETTLGLFRFLKSPLVMTGLTALLLKMRWRKLASLPRFAWKGWRLLSFFRRMRS
jgi:hypothetical protein